MRETKYGELVVRIAPSREELGTLAAADFVADLNTVMEKKDHPSVILGRGNSHLSFVQALSIAPGIAWSRVEVAHLSEWGVPATHPFSSRHWLNRHLFSRVTPKAFHELRADHQPVEEEVGRYSDLLLRLDPDISVINVGESGRFGFNNPPVDFTDDHLVDVFRLSESDREQEVADGHFSSVEDTPLVALTLTFHALIQRPRSVYVVVPGPEKASTVARVLEGSPDPGLPASILTTMPHARLYLDEDSASELA